MMSDNFITLAAAGEILSLDEKTVRRYITQGKLAGFRIGPRAVRVREGDVRALAQPDIDAEDGIRNLHIVVPVRRDVTDVDAVAELVAEIARIKVRETWEAVS